MNGKRRQKWHGGFATRLEAELFRARLVGEKLDRDDVPAEWRLPARRRPKPQPAVYFIQEGADGPVKIGVGMGGCFDRLSALQTGNPRALVLRGTVPGGRELEAALHEHFAAHLVRGEWFEPVPELLALIASLGDRALPSG